MKINTQTILKLIFSLVLPLIVGGGSGYLVKNETNGAWFSSLAKPSFNLRAGHFQIDAGTNGSAESGADINSRVTKPIPKAPPKQPAVT